jgi:hypothetical protein
MNNYDEIKTLIEASRKALKINLSESEKNVIKENYGLITEDIEDMEISTKEYETADDDSLDKKNETKKSDKKQAYRISGGILVIHGKTTKDLQITTEDKRAFQESMDEFVDEVSELVDFGKLNKFQN